MRLLQRIAARGPVPAVARAYSFWGEHARGWIVLGVSGALADRRHRDVWLTTAAGAFTAHAAAVILKRFVRRRRPSDARIRVLVDTPSDLSFPSAHAASTTAAAFALAPLVGRGTAASAATAMGLARVLLGVHYPSDVAVGAAIGMVASHIVRKSVRGRLEP